MASAATITVTPTVTTVGALFKYSYSISNTGSDDSFLIDIPVSGPITNLKTPAGFTSAFDSGLDLVSFLENTSMFGPTPVSGFSFQSPFAPSPVLFQATLLSNTTGDLYTLSGPTQSPVPEPGYFPLLLLMGTACLITIRGRRRDGVTAWSKE